MSKATATEATPTTKALITFLKECQFQKPDPSKLQELIQKGANPFFPVDLPATFYNDPYKGPLISYLIFKGMVDAVQICLQGTPEAVNFTEKDLSGDTPLHKACYGHLSDEDTAALLRAIVHRLETHPTDKVDWMLQNAKHQSMLQLAALHQKLSTVWPIVCNAPALGDAVDPISLGEVWEWDWSAVQNQKAFKVEREKITKADAPTAKLWREVSQHLQNQERLLSLVDAGADINYSHSADEAPVLCTLFTNYPAEIIEAVLSRYKKCVDFTIAFRGNTALHLVWNTTEVNHENAIRKISVVLQRMAKNPSDKIDWCVKTMGGDTVLSLAGKRQSLAAVWNLLNTLPAFQSLKEPIALSEVWRHDWDLIPAADQKNRFRASTIIEADAATGKLWQLVETAKKDLPLLQKCIQDGANISFHYTYRYVNNTILCFLIRSYDAAHVAAAFQTPLAVDFTVVDGDGDTALHCLCYPSCDAAAEKLQLIIRRLEQQQQKKDSIDWSQRNKSGADFISLAASMGKLSEFWPLLQKVSFYASQKAGGIALLNGTMAKDWDALSKESQAKFAVQKIDRA